MKKSVRKLNLIALTMLISLSFTFQAQASVKSFFGKLFHKDARRVHTLIITGNYAESRLLAELIQAKTKQPILLFSKNVMNAHDVYYLPKGQDAYQIPFKDYKEYVKFCNPERLIILGNNNYLPKELIADFDNLYAVIKINGNDWIKNADAAGLIIKDKKLAKQYQEYLNKLINGGAAQPQAAPVSPMPQPGI